MSDRNDVIIAKLQVSLELTRIAPGAHPLARFKEAWQAVTECVMVGTHARESSAKEE